MPRRSPIRTAALIAYGFALLDLAGLAGCADSTGTAPIPVDAPMATVVWNAEARLVVTASSRVLTAMAPTQAAAIQVTLQNELHQPTADTPAALAPAMVQGVRSRGQSR